MRGMRIRTAFLCFLLSWASACSFPTSIESSFGKPPGSSSTPATVMTVATPTFSVSAGTYTTIQSVSISTTTAGATIYYTVDGTPPTTSSQLYSGAITISQAETLKAIAVLTNWSNSAIASALYTIAVDTPNFSVSQGTYTTSQAITLSTVASGTSIYYTTDGSTPTTSSSLYSAPIVVPRDTSETIEALAVKTGWANSGIGSATYNITGTVATPSFSPAAGSYSNNQAVTISSTAGATIYYTTDGSVPDSSSTQYTGPVTVSQSETLKAIAMETNWITSSVGSAVYTMTVATPTFSVSAGLYLVPQSVTISTTTAGATIYYTTDGSTPTSSSSLYSGPVIVSSAEILKALAVETNWTSSSVASSGAYSFNLSGACTSDATCPGTYFCDSAALCASGSDNTGGACSTNDNCSYGYYCNSGSCTSLTVGATAISTPAGLNGISCSGHYYLSGNINMGGVSFTPLCSSGFSGTLEGNGFTISNITYQNSGTNNVGLFAELTGATIDGLNLQNVNLSGSSYVGGIAGEVSTGTIQNSYVTGSFRGAGGDFFVGGITGELNGGIIENCGFSGSATGSDYVGGIVGTQAGGTTVSNCYAMGLISVAILGDFIGGLVGFQYGSIKNSYFAGNVLGTGCSFVGGVTGTQEGGVTQSTYSTATVSGSLYIGGLVGDLACAAVATIENSYASGSVQGSQNVGGALGGC